MIGSVVTASFVMASVGAFYLLTQRARGVWPHVRAPGRDRRDRLDVSDGLPDRRRAGQDIAWHQPATLAAMEGLFETEQGAPLAIVGQPDVEKRRLDNPLMSRARSAF